MSKAAVATRSMSQTQRRRFIEIINRFSKAHVLVVGDFILDQFIWGNVDRVSPEAPVPVVHVQRDSYMPGGALNCANNIRTLAGTVYPCGVVGRDLEGRMLLKAMRREGIDTGGVVYDRQRPTSVKTRIIAHSQQVVRFDRENKSEISKDDQRRMLRFIRQKVKHVDVVILEDYGKGVILPSLVREIVRVCKQAKKPVLVDPKEKHFSYYKGVTALTPNRMEAQSAFQNGALTSRAHHAPLGLEQMGRNLIKKLQAQAVLVTLGEDGMALFEKNGSLTKIPTTARQVYDVSGAGDTVISVMALALAARASMKDASYLANLAAGIVVGKLGTATIGQDELQEAVENPA